MGQPVVYFEVVGRDGDRLKAYYADLFDWEFEDAKVPMNYGLVPRDGNTNAEGVGIGGGIGGFEGSNGGLVTFYVEVPDIEGVIRKAESLGGKCVMGPHEVPGAGILIAHLSDPEGHVVGAVQSSV